MGLVLFAEHCASCHGRFGHGDGERAKALRTKPADLTRLSERNGWVFPAAAVARAIEGADQAHRSGEMPPWGGVFAIRTAAEDADAAQKLEALTSYLEFIQAHPPRR